MELSTWAERILSADTLEEKLLRPNKLTDQRPGPAQTWNEPVRPKGMEFTTYQRKHKLPRRHELICPEKRAVCLHRFAGHELLAVEMMAYALLAFPQAPKHFRRGVASTLLEEQQHVQLYCKQLQRLGMQFGNAPLYRHFWSCTPHLTTPLQYVSVVSLSFEMANLDYAPAFKRDFAAVGDLEAAALMEKIYQDEITHVAFGWHWLKRWKQHDCSDWEAFCANLPEGFSPKRAMGKPFCEASRKQAGISEPWLVDFKRAVGL